MRRKRPYHLFLAVLVLAFLPGCAALAISLLAAGAGMAAGKAVTYTVDGYAFQTFTAPIAKVRIVAIRTLRRMGVKVKEREKLEDGELITANGVDRQIEVKLEPVSKRTTRVRTVAKQGVFLKDRATAKEILEQMEMVLKGT